MPLEAAPSDGLELPGARHVWIPAGEVRLHAVEAGEGPLVLLLHGFPEFWWSWRHQIPALVAAGFRVVAPDLRGYNLSDRPPRVADYHLDHLTADVAGVVRALGEDRAHVVGHDWGGAVAYAFAMRYPGMLKRLSILNAPHPEGFRRALFTSARQRRRSWYMFFFQLPGLPERFLRKDDYRLLRRALGTGRNTASSPADVEPYVDAARRADGLHQALHYYRAMMRGFVTRSLPAPTRIDGPLLVIWGRDDEALGEELAEPPPGWVKDVRVERIAGASHWVQVDAPARVNELLLEFLGGR